MSIMKKIEIDGKPVAFKASAAIPRIYRSSSRGIFTRICVLWKRVLVTGIRRSLPWICFLWKCLRISRM